MDYGKVLRRSVRNVRANREEKFATDSRKVLRGGIDGTAQVADWKQSATDYRRIWCGGAGTVRATEGEQSAADSRIIFA